MKVMSVCKDSVWLIEVYRVYIKVIVDVVGNWMEGTETEVHELVGKPWEIFLVNGKIFNRDQCCIIKTLKMISG